MAWRRVTRDEADWSTNDGKLTCATYEDKWFCDHGGVGPEPGSHTNKCLRFERAFCRCGPGLRV